ncbi:MAG: LPP20 family lipoprotein [Sulfurimonas sp.]|nr:LPP20 family lipoprotein [Sulfurimonas sp.]MDQ7061938.1 LPP20 family lipoprotein [Sulfurimonas sp.]
MTRNLIKSVAAAAVLSVMFAGCSDKEPGISASDEKVDFRCRQDGVLAPEFTCDPFSSGSITALGVAKMNAGNDKAYQRTEAMASARDGLARQMEVKVSNLFKKYKATTGSGSEATFDKATSDVSKQLASQTLTGSKQIGRSWRHPETNELFLMVGVTTAEVKSKMEDAVKTSFKSDRAMYQKFLAEKANGELSRELEKAGL